MNRMIYKMVLNLLPYDRDINGNAIYKITKSEKDDTSYFDELGGWSITRVEEINGVDISFEGENNTVVLFGENNFINCKFELKRDDTIIICHSVNIIRNLKISSLRQGTLTWIGENFSSSQVHINLKEEKYVLIGNDCMFSNGINILNSDMHAILDCCGNCVNPGKDVIIGNHVWIGQNVEILKGTVIQDNTIVGANATVASEFNKGNICIAGNPAKILKENVNWSRKSPECFG